MSAPSDGEAGIASGGEETVWLLGQPHLSEYLEFVREKVRGGADIPPHKLADEWRAANDLYYELEKAEAGIAETVRTRPLDAKCAALVEEVRADRYFRNTFDTLPTEFVLVELDKLVASQIFVTHSFSNDLAARLGRRPSPEKLFRLCLPTEPASSHRSRYESSAAIASNSARHRPTFGRTSRICWTRSNSTRSTRMARRGRGLHWLPASVPIS